MLKLFRNIRQNLLSEGKTSKYFKYAIGEIVLVVIGILIALQINNWNSNRLENLEEENVLRSLKLDFLESKKNVDNTILLQTNVVNHCNRLYQIMVEQDKTISPDSLGIYLYIGAYSYWRVEPTNGTYDALIGSGKTAIIKNQKLNRLLAEYSAELKFGFEDEVSDMDLATLLVDKSSTYGAILGKNLLARYNLKTNTSFSENETNSAVNQLLSNKSFLGILVMKYACAQNRLDYQKNISKYIEKILFVIDEELTANN